MPYIIMKTLSAGPDGIHHPGSRRTLPGHEAAILVRGGFAEYADLQPERVAVVIPEETEAVEPVSVAPKLKKPGRPKK